MASFWKFNFKSICKLYSLDWILRYEWLSKMIVTDLTSYRLRHESRLSHFDIDSFCKKVTWEAAIYLKANCILIVVRFFFSSLLFDKCLTAPVNKFFSPVLIIENAAFRRLHVKHYRISSTTVPTIRSCVLSTAATVFRDFLVRIQVL